MMKRELKINLKSFLLWSAILLGMFLMVYLIYPYIITEEAMKELDAMMNSMPKEMLKVFNMDIDSMTTAYGWLKTEGFVYVLLIVGMYASYLGYNTVSSEEYNKTIEYLGVLPITRNKIMTNKVIVGLIYITLMVLILSIFNYIGLLLSGDFDQKQYLLLSITPLFIAYPLFGINLFISSMINHPKKNFVIGLGLVFIFYVLNLLSELSDKVEYIKYFSIYTLADTRNVIKNIELNPILIIISLLITVFFILLSYIRYNKKELV